MYIICTCLTTFLYLNMSNNTSWNLQIVQWNNRHSSDSKDCMLILTALLLHLASQHIHTYQGFIWRLYFGGETTSRIVRRGTTLQ